MKETTRLELVAYQEERLAGFMADNTKLAKGQIVFAGDSITEFFALKKYLGRELPLLNRGIAGTDSVWLQDHLKEQVLDLEPSKIVLMIGINDLGRGYEVRDIVNRLSDMVVEIRSNLWGTPIYLLSVFPFNEEESYQATVKIRNNQTIEALNQQLSVLPGVTFVDLYPLLLDAKGQLADTYTRDGLHLSPEGYETIAQVIIKEVIE